MPEEEQKILRVEIDGIWISDQFADFLRTIADIYGLRAIFAIERQDLEEMRLRYHDLLEAQKRLGRGTTRHLLPGIRSPLIDPKNPLDALRLLEPHEQLYVKRIQFASPGFTDLAGLGSIVGHIKDFLLRLIELVTTGEQRRLENQKKRIEIARELVGLTKEMGYSSVEIRKFVHVVDDKQVKLLPFIEEGKIHGVRLLNQERNDKRD